MYSKREKAPQIVMAKPSPTSDDYRSPKREAPGLDKLGTEQRTRKGGGKKEKREPISWRTLSSSPSQVHHHQFIFLFSSPFTYLT